MDLLGLDEGEPEQGDANPLAEQDNEENIEALKTPRKKRPTLTPDLFASRLPEVTNFKFNYREGKEEVDTRKLIDTYKHWCKLLFPTLSFDAFLAKGYSFPLFSLSLLC